MSSLNACTSLHSTSSKRHMASETSLFDQSLKNFKKLKDSELQKVSSEKHSSVLLHHGAETKKVILIMHGLHESPYYMRSFSEFFFNQGYNVLSLLMPGHQNRDKTALQNVRYKEWVAAAENALEIAQGLGKDVEILGYSTGGTLAAHLALEHPTVVKKLYLISPALALSNKVFLSNLVLGWTNVDSKKICTTYDSDSCLCRALLLTDDQIAPMAREGLVASPAAGFEVQRLIDSIIRKYAPNSYLDMENNENYYSKLHTIYNKIQVPLFIADTENDTVIHQNFNTQFANEYKNSQKVVILFSKKTKITHLSITKEKDKGFDQVPEIYNPQFNRILEGMKKLIATEN